MPSDKKSELLEQLSELHHGAEDMLTIINLSVSLFQNSPDAIVVSDANGRIILVNSQAEFLTGYHRSQLRGASVDVLVPGELRSSHARVHRPNFMSHPRMREMGESLSLRLLRKDGSDVLVDIHLSPVVTVDGVIVISVIRRIKEVNGDASPGR